MTYIGFDFGTRKIGVASGESVTNTATALTIIACIKHKPDWPIINQIISQWRPAGLVVGIPTHMDNRTQSMTHKAQRFCRQLEGRYKLPVHGIDERLSSLAAIQISNKPMIDDIAAQIILQSWLNEHDN